MKTIKKTKAMKITKDTQTVWTLKKGYTVIATDRGEYYIRVYSQYNSCSYIVRYTKAEMIEFFGLTDDQFENIANSGI